MKRLLSILLLMGAIAIVTARAQAPETVLVLSTSSREHISISAGFKSAFGGGVREINLNGSESQQRKIGEELKAKKPAVLAVAGDMAVQMAKWYLDGVPTVYCDSARAVKFSAASGNTIGVYHESDPADQLKYIKELFPGKKRVALLYNPELTRVNKDDIKKRSQSLGLTLEVTPITNIKEVPAKVQALITQVDLLWVLTDPVVLSSNSNQYIVLQSISAKAPIFCGDNSLAHGGATAALVPDFVDVGKIAAAQAKLMLKGAQPSKKNMLYPRGKLVLNQKLAALFQINFPAASLNQASEVIR